MKANPILQEIWDIKDELARAANYDVRQLCENTRRWMEEHPHNGPVVRNAEELRQRAATREREQADNLALREEPPKPEKS